MWRQVYLRRTVSHRVLRDALARVLALPGEDFPVVSWSAVKRGLTDTGTAENFAYTNPVSGEFRELVDICLKHPPSDEMAVFIALARELDMEVLVADELSEDPYDMILVTPIGAVRRVALVPSDESEKIAVVDRSAS